MVNKLKRRYMHLMDGQSACFDEKYNYMFFASHIDLEKLPKYLYQIKKEQKLAKESDSDVPFKPKRSYSYMIVRI